MRELPNSDERQVAPTFAQIRKDHRERYKLVGQHISEKAVIDFGCGVGYGSKWLRDCGARVVGVDKDAAAIDYARIHYSGDNLEFRRMDVVEAADTIDTQVAVAFEIIEHLEKPMPFLCAIDAEYLWASVPNELVFPYSLNILYHYRHYTPEEFEKMLNACGWEVLRWWGQADAESKPVLETQGRTQIVLAHRTFEPRGGTWANLGPVPETKFVVQGQPHSHSTGASPKTVMLCGLGPSKYELTEAMLRHDFEPLWDELWTVNKGIDFLPRADVAWIMDDVYDFAFRHPAYGEAMKRFGGKIIGQTCLPHDGSIPFSEYPLAEVLDFWGGSAQNWFHTISIGYALAYAGMIGVKRLMLAGIDCSWPNRPDLSEAGHGIVCYWIGRLEGIGCVVEINSDSTLNHTNQHDRYEWRRFYGYLAQPKLL